MFSYFLLWRATACVPAPDVHWVFTCRPPPCHNPFDDDKDSGSGCRGRVHWTSAGGGFPERGDREWTDSGEDLPAERARRILSRNPVRLVRSRLQFADRKSTRLNSSHLGIS